VAVCLLLTGAGCGSDVTGPTGDGWTLERIASGHLVGAYSSLTRAADGTVHVAYHDARLYRLFHARRTAPDQWESTRIDSAGWMGHDVVLRAGSDGDTLHLAYQDVWERRLRYARYDGSSWSHEYVDLRAAYGERPAISIQADGPHLVELNPDTEHVAYWARTGSGWSRLSTQRISSARPALAFTVGPYGPAFAIVTYLTLSSYRNSPVGFRVLLYTAASGDGPWTGAVLHERQFTLETGKARGATPRGVGIESDLSGVLHVLFRDADGVLHDSAGDLVDTGVRNAYIRLRKDSVGDLWVLYPRGSGLSLSKWTSSGGWNRVAAIGSLNPEGLWDLHIDDAGAVHVSVYSASTRSLWYGLWEERP
jgi:hypothetical protein